MTATTEHWDSSVIQEDRMPGCIIEFSELAGQGDLISSCPLFGNDANCDSGFISSSLSNKIRIVEIKRVVYVREQSIGHM